MNRLDVLLRALAAWPGGRLQLKLYADAGKVVASVVDCDGTRVCWATGMDAGSAIVEIMTSVLEHVAMREVSR